MKEQTKRKLLGARLYAVYRRIRFMRYLNKVRRQRKRDFRREVSAEADAHRESLAQQRRRARREVRTRKQQLVREERRERKAHKAAMGAQRKQEKARERRKRATEKEDLLRIRRETRDAARQQSSREKELEKERARLMKEEHRAQRREMKLRLREKAVLDRQEEANQRVQRKFERKVRKQRIRRIRPYLFRRRTRETLRSIRSIDGQTLRRWLLWSVQLAESRSDRNRFIKITLNSTSLFVLAYLTLYITGEWITLYAAQTFEFKTILFYYKIYYNIDSDQWTPDAVKILYSIKPLAGLVLGSVALVIFSSIRNDRQVFKLFFLWLFIHGMVMFFGSLLLGTLLNQGFGWVIAYLYYRDTGKMVFSIISIFALVVTGTAVARSFLLSGNAYFNFVNRDNRRFLLLSQVILPVLLGTFITSLMKVPNDLYFTTSEEVTYEIFKLSTILIVLIPIILSFSSFTTVYFDEEKRNVRFHWIYILIFAGIYLGYRFLFMNGVEFAAF